MYIAQSSGITLSTRPKRSAEYAPGWYHPRVDTLKQNLDLDGYFALVRNWVLARPPLIPHDADRQVMFGKNVPGEIWEAKVEQKKKGAEFDGRALVTEWADIAFFVGAYLNARNMALDTSEVRRNLNGHGQRSDIYDRLTNISGNITEQSQRRDILEFLRVWMVGLAGLPVKYPAEQIHQLVVDKNTKNYPAKFLSGIHPVTGVALNPDEMEQQYVHSRRSLKHIRNTLRDGMGLKDRDYGLHESDYQNYARLIEDFEHPETAFAELAAEYPRDPAILALGKKKGKLLQ